VRNRCISREPRVAVIAADHHAAEEMRRAGFARAPGSAFRREAAVHRHSHSVVSVGSWPVFNKFNFIYQFQCVSV
jgi:hypothetical protein